METFTILLFLAYFFKFKLNFLQTTCLSFLSIMIIIAIIEDLYPIGLLTWLGLNLSFCYWLCSLNLSFIHKRSVSSPSDFCTLTGLIKSRRHLEPYSRNNFVKPDNRVIVCDCCTENVYLSPVSSHKILKKPRVTYAPLFQPV